MNSREHFQYFPDRESWVGTAERAMVQHANQSDALTCVHRHQKYRHPDERYHCQQQWHPLSLPTPSYLWIRRTWSRKWGRRDNGIRKIEGTLQPSRLSVHSNFIAHPTILFHNSEYVCYFPIISVMRSESRTALWWMHVGCRVKTFVERSWLGNKVVNCGTVTTRAVQSARRCSCRSRGKHPP